MSGAQLDAAVLIGTDLRKANLRAVKHHLSPAASSGVRALPRCDRLAHPVFRALRALIIE
jgi:hypothetical protein